MDPSRVWAEVEIPADVDWQPMADTTRTKDIKDQIPAGGYYRFPGAKGVEWRISGAIKVNRVLTNQEVEELNKWSTQ